MPINVESSTFATAATAVTVDADDHLFIVQDGALKPITTDQYAQTSGIAARYPSVRQLAVASPTNTDVQALVDAAGTTASMRGAWFQVPSGVVTLAGTVTIDRKSGRFEGVGSGSSSQASGSVLKWTGAAALPMIDVRRCWDQSIGFLRLMGNSTAKPDGIVFTQTTGDSPYNTGNTVHDVWIGAYGGFDTDNAVQIRNGIRTTGDNLQGDQSSIRRAHIEGCSESCIRFEDTQNVIWALDDLKLNSAVNGIRTAARYIVARSVFFSSITGACIYFDDGSVLIDGCQAEGCAQLADAATALMGCRLHIREGYFQAAAAKIIASGLVVDINAGGTGASSLIIEDFEFTRETAYAGPQEKIKVRQSKAFIHLKNSAIPGPPDTVLDLTTAIAGETRHVVLENVISSITGVRYNGTYFWTHGDTAPSMNVGNDLVAGFYNTRAGSNALAAVTTGITHTAFGKSALAAVTTANNNTAVGYTALAAMTAANSTGIGNAAGSASTSAGVTAVGSDTVVNAANTTALGYLANASNIGSVALGSSTTTTEINQVQIGGRHVEMVEMTAPVAGATNSARLFSRDNGAGKTQLCVIFATGAIQVLATEP